jgi:hypothetical protein
LPRFSSTARSTNQIDRVDDEEEGPSRPNTHGSKSKVGFGLTGYMSKQVGLRPNKTVVSKTEAAMILPLH